MHTNILIFNFEEIYKDIKLKYFIFCRSGGADSPCEDYLQVCCNVGDSLSPEYRPTPPPTIRQGCGQRNPEGVTFRITGNKDKESEFGEFPWMVAIINVVQKDNIQQNYYLAGGSLIHPRVVLTAAHRLNGYN